MIKALTTHAPQSYLRFAGFFDCVAPALETPSQIENSNSQANFALAVFTNNQISVTVPWFFRFRLWSALVGFQNLASNAGQFLGGLGLLYPRLRLGIKNNNIVKNFFDFYPVMITSSGGNVVERIFSSKDYFFGLPSDMGQTVQYSAPPNPAAGCFSQSILPQNLPFVMGNFFENPQDSILNYGQSNTTFYKDASSKQATMRNSKLLHIITNIFNAAVPISFLCVLQEKVFEQVGNEILITRNGIPISGYSPFTAFSYPNPGLPSYNIGGIPALQFLFLIFLIELELTE